MSKKKVCLLLISCGVNEQKRYGGQGSYDGINLHKNRNGLSHISQIKKKNQSFSTRNCKKTPEFGDRLS